MTLNVNRLLLKSLKIAIVIFFLVMCYFHLRTPGGAGDEMIFMNDLNFIKSHGWISAIEKKIGLTFLLLAYPLSYILPDFIALRATNILLFLALLFYFYKWGAIKNQLFFFYFLFISSFGFFLTGTNDTLYIVAITIFFNEVYKFIEMKEKCSMPLLCSTLIIAFFTRELIYVYLPVILLSLILLWKNKLMHFQKWPIPASILALLLLLNLPSLQKNHRLSYDNKEPSNQTKSSWVQRQYLAQLLVNEGKLANQHHPSWEDTDAYLRKYGENALPKTTFQSLIFNPKLTLLEFVKDFTSSVFLSIRQTGMIVIFVFLYLAFCLFKRKIDTNLFLPVVSFTVLATFSFIIISFVETRWLLVSYIVAIIYYSDLEYTKKLPKSVLLTNHLVLLLVIFYGSFKVFLKF